MTPKLRLSEQARKALLSCMRKFLLPGRRRTRTSTQMMLAPKTHAMPLTKVMIHPRVSLSSPLTTSSMAGEVCGGPKRSRFRYQALRHERRGGMVRRTQGGRLLRCRDYRGRVLSRCSGAGKRRFWASNLTVLTTANRQRRAVAAVADVPEPGSILQGGSGHQSLFSGWWDDGGDGWMDRKGMAWVGEGRVWVRALVTELAGRTAQERIVWAGSRSNKGPRSPTAPAV